MEFLWGMETEKASMKRMARARANRTGRINIKQGKIHEDFLNVKTNFGVGEGERGIPTLRWDNAVSREVRWWCLVESW